MRQLTFFLSIFLIISSITFSQQEAEDVLKSKADKAYKVDNYVEASKYYAQLLTFNQKDPFYNFRYGVCLLYNSSKKSEAIKHLTFSSRVEGFDPEVFYFLGKAYHLDYNFDQAIKNYKIFKEKASPKLSAEVKIDRQITMSEKGKRLLTSPNEIVVLEKNEIEQSNFFRIYNLSDIGGNLIVTAQFQSKIDKKRNHVPLIHFPNNPKQIFYSSYGEDETNGKDIYMRQRLPDGSWSLAQKINGPVNTEFDEDYPYLHPNGNYLYFSSKGHNSMGGYDIFKARYNAESKSFDMPENIDFPISSPDNDLFYIVDSLNENAYFSSSRQSKDGKVHVYKVEVEFIPIQFVAVKSNFISTIDPKNKKLSVEVFDYALNKKVGVFNSSSNGSVLFTFPKGGKYEYVISVEGSDKVFRHIVSIPFLKAFKPLKQQMIHTMDDKNQEIVKLINLFDEDLEDAFDVMREIALMRSELNPNVDQFPTKKVNSISDNSTIYKSLGLPKISDFEMKENLQTWLDKVEIANAEIIKIKENSLNQSIENIKNIVKLQEELKLVVSEANTKFGNDRRDKFEEAGKLVNELTYLEEYSKKLLLNADSLNTVISDNAAEYNEYKKLVSHLVEVYNGGDMKEFGSQVNDGSKKIIALKSEDTKSVINTLKDVVLDYHQDIKKMEGKIQQAKTSISKNNVDLESLNKELEAAKAKSKPAIQAKIDETKLEVDVASKEISNQEKKIEQSNLKLIEKETSLYFYEDVLDSKANKSTSTVAAALNTLKNADNQNTRTLKAYVDQQLKELGVELNQIKSKSEIAFENKHNSSFARNNAKNSGVNKDAESLNLLAEQGNSSVSNSDKGASGSNSNDPKKTVNSNENTGSSQANLKENQNNSQEKSTDKSTSVSNGSDPKKTVNSNENTGSSQANLKENQNNSQEKSADKSTSISNSSDPKKTVSSNENTVSSQANLKENQNYSQEKSADKSTSASNGKDTEKTTKANENKENKNNTTENSVDKSSSVSTESDQKKTVKSNENSLSTETKSTNNQNNSTENSANNSSTTKGANVSNSNDNVTSSKINSTANALGDKVQPNDYILAKSKENNKNKELIQSNPNLSEELKMKGLLRQDKLLLLKIYKEIEKITQEIGSNATNEELLTQKGELEKMKESLLNGINTQVNLISEKFPDAFRNSSMNEDEAILQFAPNHKNNVANIEMNKSFTDYTKAKLIKAEKENLTKEIQLEKEIFKAEIQNDLNNKALKLEYRLLDNIELETKKEIENQDKIISSFRIKQTLKELGTEVESTIDPALLAGDPKIIGYRKELLKENISLFGKTGNSVEEIANQNNILTNYYNQLSEKQFEIEKNSKLKTKDTTFKSEIKLINQELDLVRKKIDENELKSDEIDKAILADNYIVLNNEISFLKQEVNEFNVLLKDENTPKKDKEEIKKKLVENLSKQTDTYEKLNTLQSAIINKYPPNKVRNKRQAKMPQNILDSLEFERFKITDAEIKKEIFEFKDTKKDSKKLKMLPELIEKQESNSIIAQRLLYNTQMKKHLRQVVKYTDNIYALESTTTLEKSKLKLNDALEDAEKLIAKEKLKLTKAKKKKKIVHVNNISALKNEINNIETLQKEIQSVIDKRKEFQALFEKEEQKREPLTITDEAKLRANPQYTEAQKLYVQRMLSKEAMKLLIESLEESKNRYNNAMVDYANNPTKKNKQYTSQTFDDLVNAFKQYSELQLKYEETDVTYKNTVAKFTPLVAYEQLFMDDYKTQLIEKSNAKDKEKVINQYDMIAFEDKINFNNMVPAKGIHYQVLIGNMDKFLLPVVFEKNEVINATINPNGLTSFYTEFYGSAQTAEKKVLEFKNIGYMNTKIVAYKDGIEVNYNEIKFQTDGEYFTALEAANKKANSKKKGKKKVTKAKPKSKPKTTTNESNDNYIVNTSTINSNQNSNNTAEIATKVGDNSNSTTNSNQELNKEKSVDVSNLQKANEVKNSSTNSTSNTETKNINVTNSSTINDSKTDSKKSTNSVNGSNSSSQKANNSNNTVSSKTKKVANVDPYDNLKNAIPIETKPGLFFTVQVGAFMNKKFPTNLHDIQEVFSKTFTDGVIRYSTGVFHSVDEARITKQKVIEMGVFDAFITAYYNGQRITVAEAEKLLAENGNEILEKK